MKKTNRLIHIINLLRNNRSFNAEKLARTCGVTERTIYRDIISLSEANIPVYYDRGYKLAANTFMPPLNFDIEEFMAIKLALENSILKQNSPFQAAIKRVEAKITTVLNGGIPSELKSKPLSTQLKGKSTDNFTAAKITIFKQLELAIKEKQRIGIRYQGLKGEPSDRIIDPYYIIFRKHAFYLIAYCHKRNEFRTFRIGRIKRITLQGENFVMDGRFTLDSYFENSWEVFTGPPVEIEVKFTGQAARVVATGRHHKTEKIKKLKNGDLIYRVTTAGVEEISMWLKQFGPEAIVIKPEKLRNLLREFYLKSVEAYK